MLWTIFENHPISSYPGKWLPSLFISLLVSLEKYITRVETEERQASIKPMSSSKELVRIPNFFSFTPFKWQGINPNHSSIIKTTKEWVLSQGNLDEVKQRKIDDAKCELFGAATYPYVDLDMLYVLNDSVVIVLLLDKITDELEYEGVLAIKETTLNAMTGKTPNDHCLVANFMRE